MMIKANSRPVRIFYNIKLFIIGAAGYGAIELLWRGFTHWTMLLAGGTWFMMYYKLCEDEKNMPLFAKCFFGALIITCVELIFGTVVNVALRWNVWDYSGIPINFYGQICLPFFVLWYILCVPLTLLCTAIQKQHARRAIQA
mgnify:CR=1 FL=1